MKKFYFVQTPAQSSSESQLVSGAPIIFIDKENSADAIVQEILSKAGSDERIDLVSTVGLTNAASNIQKVAEFYFELFQKIVRLKRPIRILALAHFDSLLTGAVEGIALSALQESSFLEFKTLYSDVSEITRPIFERCFLEQSPRLFFSSGKLEKAELTSASSPKGSIELSANKNYVILGGAGGIGQQLTTYLAKNYQARVFIIGRRDLNAALRSQLKTAGAVAYLKTDITDADGLRATFEHIQAHYGDIHGVFHLAGHLEDDRLVHLGLNQFRSVWSVKVDGALNLAKITAQMPIGFVCCFSSLTSILGNVGQSAYAAANGFLDTFCAVQSSFTRFSRWISINWGLWEAEGMKMNIASSDLSPIAIDAGCDALREVLHEGQSRAVVFEGSNALVRSYLESAPQRSSLPSPEANEISAWLTELVKKFSGISSISSSASFIESGLDSVALINIASAIENRFRAQHPNFKLSKAVLFDYPSVEALTHYLRNAVSIPLSISAHNLPNSKIQIQDTDIAIIGMSGEFPSASTVDELWENLIQAKCSVQTIPADRWNWKTRGHGRHGGFIKDAMHFDPSFFQITPKEAIILDPQERRFLMTAYHALEDCGHFAKPHSNVGVFASAMFGHYQNLDPDSQAPLLNSSFASIANRVSYSLNLKGPSFAVDSMCSGSLTAIHQAVLSLNHSDCEIALVGGVNIMPHAGKYRLLSQGNFLSPTGRCQPFGIDADGYVPGEGCVVFVLKRLNLALKNDDRIYGVIKGSALNSSGKTSGYTVPSSRAQAHVIKEAFKRSGVTPEQVTYQEAHGTGTALGDPIEIQGLLQSHGKTQQPCWLGSIKSNLGHLESAAGMAGLAKILLQYQHNQIAPTLFCEIENPELQLRDTRFRLAKQPLAYSAGEPRYAGLSSFGAGGSCSHLIVSDYPSSASPTPSQETYLIPISAKSETSLNRRLQELSQFLKKNPQTDLYSLSYTLSCTREHFVCRKIYLVRTIEELRSQLEGHTTASISNEFRDQYLKGGAVDFAKLYPVKKLIRLPGYSFDTQKYEVNLNHYLSSPVAPQRTTISNKKSSWFEPVWVPAPGPSALDSQSKNKQRIIIQDVEFEIAPYLENSSPDPISLIFMPFHSAEKVDLKRFHYELALTLIRSKRQFEILFLHSNADISQDLQFSFHALYKNLGLESPAIRTRLVEFTEGELPDWETLELEFANEIPFAHLRYENGQRFRRSYQLVSATHPSYRIQPEDVIVVTGGLGRIGKNLCKTLIQGAGARIAILGRSKLSESLEKSLREISTDPNRLLYLSADLNDAGETQKAIDSILATFGRIDGIIHAAAVLKDALLENKSYEDFSNVIDTKVRGALHLDQATCNLSLKFFALFSSISNIFGNVGQCDYVVGNSFLDRFAQNRNIQVKHGLRSGHSLSINWPLWIEEQKDANDPMEKYRALSTYLWDQFGLKPFTSDQGVIECREIIDHINASTSQCIPLPGDEQKLKDTLANLDWNEPAHSESVVTNSKSNPDTMLLEIISAITGLDSKHLSQTQNFGDLGINSVLLQQLAEKISAEFQIHFPAVALFKYNTIQSLEEYLRRTNPSSSAPQRRQTNAQTLTTTESQTLTATENTFAIIGIDGRMPGGKNLEDYWKLLEANQSAIGPVARWKDFKSQAGLIPRIEFFDAKFFNLSPREAKLLDPQHRLFLQSSYQCFLNAGYNPRTLSNVGVFAGVQFNDYQSLLQKSETLNHPFAATGNAQAMLANRVSYFWNFNGPSQTYDTACSSAFVAIRNALKSLQTNECDVALAGAVSLLLDPEITQAAESMGVLSPNFRCATFDAAADGYVRGEGVGTVLIKRYADAVRDGDAIHALITGSAENHGGKAHSLTAPNPDSQTALLLKAYTPELAQQVSYIETHGTGTKLGDPIEIEAIKAAWEKLGLLQKNKKVGLGSVKTNVGHLEPAAGMASLFKVILSMQKGVLPASIAFSKLNPLIELEGTPFEILTENQTWKSENPRVAGISSFGFGGTNTHLVITEASAPARETRSDSESAAELITLSARSIFSLQHSSEALLHYLRTSDQRADSLSDIAFTLNQGRESFEYRLDFLVQSKEDWMQQLENVDWHSISKLILQNQSFVLKNKSMEQLKLAREAYRKGETLDWSFVNSHDRHRRLHLPGYVFDESPFWFEEGYLQ